MGLNDITNASNAAMTACYGKLYIKKCVISKTTGLNDITNACDAELTVCYGGLLWIGASLFLEPLTHTFNLLKLAFEDCFSGLESDKQP